MSGDAAELTQGLAAALDSGTLTIQEQRYEMQVRDMAAGTAAENSRIDLPVLQLITLALQRFESVGLSDLNRRCAGSNLGTSAHWIEGGGNAVDFTTLGGKPVTGNTPETFALLDLLARVAPKGTRVGQNNRRSASAALAWPTLVQLWDTYLQPPAHRLSVHQRHAQRRPVRPSPQPPGAPSRPDGRIHIVTWALPVGSAGDRWPRQSVSATMSIVPSGRDSCRARSRVSRMVARRSLSRHCVIAVAMWPAAMPRAEADERATCFQVSAS